MGGRGECRARNTELRMQNDGDGGRQLPQARPPRHSGYDNEHSRGFAAQALLDEGAEYRASCATPATAEQGNGEQASRGGEGRRTTTATAAGEGSLRKRCWPTPHRIRQRTQPGAAVLHRTEAGGTLRQTQGLRRWRYGERQRPQARVRCASAAGRHHTGYDNEHSRGRLCYTERRPTGPFDRLRDCVAGATENGNGRRRHTGNGTVERGAGEQESGSTTGTATDATGAVAPQRQRRRYRTKTNQTAYQKGSVTAQRR